MPLDVAQHAADESMLLPTLVDYGLGPGPPTLTVDEAARAAGIDVATLRRWWRAMGFADPPDDEVVAGELDVRALATTAATMGTERWALQQARAVNAAVARIVEVWAESVQALYEGGMRDAEMVDFAATGFDFERLSFLIDYIHRRQIQLTVRRLAARVRDQKDSAVATVGFVDVVNYAGLAHQSSTTDLLGLLDRFEEAAFDAVAEERGHLVKMIGDEVMFVTDEPDAAVRIACRLITLAHAAELPMVHAGLAAGPVTVRQGDYFGTTVNLASRAVGLAPSGCIAVASDLADAVQADVAKERIGAHRLKGFELELDFTLLRPT